jgi:hypothetical protein
MQRLYGCNTQWRAMIDPMAVNGAIGGWGMQQGHIILYAINKSYLGSGKRCS